MFKTQEVARESASGSESYLRTEEENVSNKIEQSRKRDNELIRRPRHRNWEGMTESSSRKVHQPAISRTVDLPKSGEFPTVPFVAGTSVSPSHNIFLYCQQVLASIKRKQSTGPGEKSEEEQQNFKESDKGEKTPPKDAAMSTMPSTITTPNTDEKTLLFKTVLRNLYDEFTTMTK